MPRNTDFLYQTTSKISKTTPKTSFDQQKSPMVRRFGRLFLTWRSEFTWPRLAQPGPSLANLEHSLITAPPVCSETTREISRRTAVEQAKRPLIGLPKVALVQPGGSSPILIAGLTGGSFCLIPRGAINTTATDPCKIPLDRSPFKRKTIFDDRDFDDLDQKT